MTAGTRIGIDLGGTKIAATALDANNRVVLEKRIPTPKNDYEATIDAIVRLCNEMETEPGRRGSVGIGIPGSISPKSGLVQNANSTWLNGHPLEKDLAAALDQPVRIENDANCFALSEAIDGAGSHAASVFGVIIGTGCGGGIAIDGKIVDGPGGIGGEWGHNPLPWPNAIEYPGPACWCGQKGCMETWLSGPGIVKDHQRTTGKLCTPEKLAALAESGDGAALSTFDRHASRMARGLAAVINMIDPGVIVLGGGLSNLKHLYRQLPEKIEPYVFADHFHIEIVPPKYGDSSGVRGAAWLWNAP